MEDYKTLFIHNFILKKLWSYSITFFHTLKYGLVLLLLKITEPVIVHGTCNRAIEGFYPMKNMRMKER